MSTDYAKNLREGDAVIILENEVVVATGIVARNSITRSSVRMERAMAGVPLFTQFSRKTGKQVGGQLMVERADDEQVAEFEQEWAQAWEDAGTAEQSEEPAQATTKVEKLAENLKHLDKPGRRDTPHYWWMATSHCVAFVVRGGWWARKAYNGRNKRMGNLGPYDMRVERELGAAVSMVRASRFFEGKTIEVPQQSQAIRNGYWHWFPVALENVTYSDSLARHFSGGLQEGLRATDSLLPRGDSWLYRKFNGRRHQDKLWAPNELWGNKAQVNRYFACKTY